MLGIFGGRVPDGVDSYEIDFRSSFSQLLCQCFGVIVVAAYSGVVTYLILRIMESRMGKLTHSEEKQDVGLDWIDHGEVAYHQMNILPSGAEGANPSTTAPSAPDSDTHDRLPTESEYRRHWGTEVHNCFAHNKGEGGDLRSRIGVHRLPNQDLDSGGQGYQTAL